MSPEVVQLQAQAHRFPRVSGDEPPYRWTGHIDEEFSPRERG